MNLRDFWKSKIPDGEHGEAKVESFYVSEKDSFFSQIRGDTVKPGHYKRLYVGGKLMMSDTSKEFRDHMHFLHQAKGDVLINGLGLGCCLQVVLNKPEVTSVTVIERSSDVIKLVGPSFPEAKIINDDAFTWKPEKGQTFDAVWHDIWPDICADNLPEMHKLHRRFGRKSDWQGSWSRETLEYIRQKDNEIGCTLG